MKYEKNCLPNSCDLVRYEGEIYGVRELIKEDLDTKTVSLEHVKTLKREGGVPSKDLQILWRLKKGDRGTVNPNSLKYLEMVGVSLSSEEE